MKKLLSEIIIIMVILTTFFNLVSALNASASVVKVDATVLMVESYRKLSAGRRGHLIYKNKYMVYVRYKYEGTEYKDVIYETEYGNIGAKNLKEGDNIKIKINPNNDYEVFNYKHDIYERIAGIIIFMGILIIIIKYCKDDGNTNNEK